ncbi:MAG TPA: MBL fold metallo-hydrolase [Syntrophomonadaceae bacterium]|nr:MBL fold metallo-hydrolase [Syntrophomonadaceae bacterium]
MEIKILTLGITNCYLIKGNQGYVLVDAGSLRKKRSFLNKLNKLNIKPEEIKLIVITHAHYDHVGTLKDIKESCGCPVAISAHEEAIVAQGRVVIPPGTNLLGKIISFIGRTFHFVLKFPAVGGEYLVKEEFPLYDYGVKGTVIPTPGHTPGSLSVILDDGRAIVGDLAMNKPIGNIYPLFAEEPDLVYESWQELIGRGVERIYPAHGRSFSIDRIIDRLP